MVTFKVFDRSGFLPGAGEGSTVFVAVPRSLVPAGKFALILVFSTLFFPCILDFIGSTDIDIFDRLESESWRSTEVRNCMSACMT